MMQGVNDFTGLYPISRTIRFQLKPVGKTEEFVKQRGFISQDDIRAEHYKTVKKIIDRRHKEFIDSTLDNFSFSGEDLKEYERLYRIEKKDESDKKAFIKKREIMRTAVAKAFSKNPEYAGLWDKELIRSGLDRICKDDEEKKLVHEFDNWTSYFSGFSENRRNIYTEKDETTAVGYRIVEQNLPKFLNNIKTYEKCIQASPDIFKGLSPELLKKFGDRELNEIFQCESFSSVLTQTSIDRYNTLLGGYSTENGEKIQGLNEFINQYNQKNKTRLPQFTSLFKQILSDRVQELSFLPEAIQDDNTLFEKVRETWNFMQNDISEIPVLFGRLHEYDLTGIFISNDATLTDVMQLVYGSWDKFRLAWFAQYEKQYPNKNLKNLEKTYKGIDSFSIAEIQKTISAVFPEYSEHAVEEYFAKPGIVIANGERTPLFLHVQQAYEAAEKLLNGSYPEGQKHFVSSADSVQVLKVFLDSLKAVQRFVKMLAGTGFETNKDMAFYAQVDSLIEALDPVTMLYNQVRNYVSAKPYSTEKIKLNFNRVTLLKGWDENKESDCLGTLFKKDNAFYLGIIRCGAKINFEEASEKSADDVYEKMVYKLLANPMRDFPKTFFSAKWSKTHDIPSDILDIYNEHKKGERQYTREESERLIQFYCDSVAVHADWKKFGFQYSAEAMHDLKLFFKESKEQSYSVRFERIPAEYINELVEKGDLYLFQIWSKDFSHFSKGTPNIHTLYWKALFDPENLADVVFKLSGEAEVFYRKSSIPEENTIRHLANQPVALRRNPQETRTFEYELIKDRRFTYDQFSLHAKIEINYKAGDVTDLNSRICSWLNQEQNPHIIGIDRGERNLIYITVIDKAGRIVCQKSLNTISSDVRGKEISTDYHELLDKREKEKRKAQKSWQSIAKIKDLKSGYLSQVIHELTSLIRDYNAILCLEDLNSGFMRGRQKVDKSVYQQFERDLIQKLQYLTDKKLSQSQPGSILHGLQLVNSKPVKGSQNGIVFYVPAWCTSKIDPKTGFVNFFGSQWLQWENIGKTQNFFSKFKEIRYNRQDDFFEFTFDYSDFTAQAAGTRTQWTVCSYGSRFESFRNPDLQNRWDCREINPTGELKKLFAEKQIDLAADLKPQIAVHDDGKFLKSLLHLFKLTLQMRNSKPNSTDPKDDYILSPVRGTDGSFFDSRKADSGMPQDADANGAYNIARKGLLLLNRIQKASADRKDLFRMTQKDWLNFVQPE